MLMVIKGFKAGCNKAYRRWLASLGEQEGRAMPQQCCSTEDKGKGHNSDGSTEDKGKGNGSTEDKGRGDNCNGNDRTHGFLFSRNYNDHILEGPDELERWFRYLDDNPRRLAVKRQHPEFFTIVRQRNIGEWSCQMVGNQALLTYPKKAAVVVHGAWSDEEYETKRRKCTVSPKTETIEVNKTVTLTATVAPDNATNKNVTWTSSDEAVAVVSSAGVVTGKSAGEATITATTVSGSKTDTATITVTPASKSYPEGTYRAVLTALGNNYDLVLAIGNATNGMISVKLSNTDVGATDIVFDNDTKNFTIHTTGNFSGYSYGDICGHYDGALDKITNIECKGDVGAAVTDNGKIEAARIEIQFDCEGTTAELQSQFKRRYRPKGGNWAVDTGNADRIQHESTFVSGEGALSIRPCGSSYDAYGLSLQDDFATAQPVKNIGFWVYNSGSSDIAFRTYLYKSAGLTNHYQIGTMTAKASQWTYCVMGFGSQTGYGAIYNFNLSVWTADNANGMSVRLIFDNIVLF